MEASREEAILMLSKWHSDASDIRCSVIREPDFRVSLSLKITSVDETGVVMVGPNENRVVLGLSEAEFEFLDSMGLPDPTFAQVADRFVEGILAVIFPQLGLSFILAARK